MAFLKLSICVYCISLCMFYNYFITVFLEVLGYLPASIWIWTCSGFSRITSKKLGLPWSGSVQPAFPSWPAEGDNPACLSSAGPPILSPDLAWLVGLLRTHPGFGVGQDWAASTLKGIQSPRNSVCQETMGRRGEETVVRSSWKPGWLSGGALSSEDPAEEGLNETCGLWLVTWGEQDLGGAWACLAVFDVSSDFSALLIWLFWEVIFIFLWTKIYENFQ